MTAIHLDEMRAEMALKKAEAIANLLSMMPPQGQKQIDNTLMRFATLASQMVEDAKSDDDVRKIADKMADIAMQTQKEEPIASMLISLVVIFVEAPTLPGSSAAKAHKIAQGLLQASFARTEEAA